MDEATSVRLAQAQAYRAAMRFTLTVRHPGEPLKREELGLADMMRETRAVGDILDAMEPGQVIEIKRIR